MARCGEFECTNQSYPWVVDGTACLGGCNFTDCCAVAWEEALAPRWSWHETCEVEAKLSEVATDDSERCATECENEGDCAVSQMNSAAQTCTLYKSGNCDAAFLEQCPTCVYSRKALLPWYNVSSTFCNATSAIQLANMSVAACMRECDKSQSCGAVVKSGDNCQMWGMPVTCNGTDLNFTDGCLGETCFYQKSSFADLCQPVLDSYIGHWGPILCIVVLSLLCLWSFLLLCSTFRPGGGGRSVYRYQCGLFLLCAVPLMLLFVIGTNPAVRRAMLVECPPYIEPAWGPFLNREVIDEPTGDFGSLNIEGCNGTHLDTWLNLGSCLQSKEWEEELRSFHFKGEETELGDYDVKIECLGDGPVFIQYKTKDGSCKDAVARKHVEENECLHGTESATGIAVHCSACDWLWWRHVKTAPYIVMLINSVCSMMFSSLCAWMGSKVSEATDIVVEEEEASDDEVPGDSSAPDYISESAGSKSHEPTGDDSKECVKQPTTRQLLQKKIELITEELTDEMSEESSMKEYAARSAAPNHYFVIVKTIFLAIFFVFCARAAAQHKATSWQRYQIMFTRLMNSGIVLLLLESARGVIGNLKMLQLLKESGSRGGPEVKENMRKVQVSIAITFFTLIIFLPVFLTHVIPMVGMFPWMLVILLVVGHFVMTWPIQYLDEQLGRDWANLVVRSPIRAYFFSQLMGIWLKFTSSFVIVLPMQMLFNYGVLAYKGHPYWQIPFEEYKSRSHWCFFEEPFEEAANALQMNKATHSPQCTNGNIIAIYDDTVEDVRALTPTVPVTRDGDGLQEMVADLQRLRAANIDTQLKCRMVQDVLLSASSVLFKEMKSDS